MEGREIFRFYVLLGNLNKLLLQQWKPWKYMYARCLDFLSIIKCLFAHNNAPYKFFMKVQVNIDQTDDLDDASYPIASKLPINQKKIHNVPPLHILEIFKFYMAQWVGQKGFKVTDCGFDPR